MRPLGANPGFGIDVDQAELIASRIKTVHEMGVQVAVVLGAGNLWRGKQGLERGMDRSTADYMGMMGTIMNSMVLMDALERIGVFTRVMSAIEMRAVAEPYIRRRAIRHLEKGRVVILGAGTGNPFFSTDTAAALRGSEIDADVVIKATKVDGIYDADPRKFPERQEVRPLSYIEYLNRRLQVMDSTAVSLCMDNKLPILVLNLWDPQALLRALAGRRSRHARHRLMGESTKSRALRCTMRTVWSPAELRPRLTSRPWQISPFSSILDLNSSVWRPH